MELDFDPRDLDSHMKCLLALGEAEEALKLLLKYAKDLRATESASKEQKHDIQMLMCRAYQKLDQRDMAIVMLQGILRERPDHEEGLLEFAKLTFDLGEEQALQSAIILLSALAKDRENKTVQLYVKEVAAKKRGLEFIQQAAGDAWSSVPALILLANVLRDHGALDESLTLLERARSLDPSSPNALLNYIHLLEVLGRPDEAISSIVAFCRSDCSSPVFAHMASRVQHILQTKDDHTVEEFDELSVPLLPYTEDDLFVLAVWYTVVKILYTQGVLWTVQFMCASLDGFYGKGGQHLTCIRNEAAYYGCISKIASSWTVTPGLPTAGTRQSLYIIGDSHCLTPAWQTIQYKNELSLLQPMLSTGTKIWHLRHDSNFYTKSNFYRSLSLIPLDATVIVLLGEIDCRESLHICVEKCRYGSLEDAVAKLVDLYVGVLLELRSQHSWTLYVHPVPPVLDITRPTVMLFNKHMRVRLTSDPIFSDIHWLNIENKLLSTDSSQLNKDYEFDNTHLHPRYTQLLQTALL